MSNAFPLHLSFADRVNEDQFQRHLSIPFEVPAGATRLTLDFEYGPIRTGDYNNLLTLTVFDPHGARGEGHRHKPTQQVILSAVEATPGYVAGVLPAGMWQVILNTQMVLEPLTYQLNIEITDVPLTGDAPAWSVGQTAPRGAGWYRGDLHSHTLHSDGGWGVPDLAAYARRERLDFITLTDHNTTAPLAELFSLASDDLLTMGGSELTTFYGHALALGTHKRYDWRIVPGERTMPDIVREIEADGGLFVIAHPHAIGNPACTGCDWTYADMMPGSARVIEIWNGNWGEDGEQNERGLRQWYDWLNAGYRMRATAGSDIHRAPQAPTTYGRNVVYAQALTERAILDGIRQGHSYISQGARLELTADADHYKQVMMGDVTPHEDAVLTITWQNAPAGALLRWIVDGEVEHEQTISDDGEAKRELTGARWCVVEMRDPSGMMHAVTNPIFFGADWR